MWTPGIKESARILPLQMRFVDNKDANFIKVNKVLFAEMNTIPVFVKVKVCLFLFVWLKHLQVRQILCHVVTLLIERISGIDWVPYLTTKYNSSMIGMIMIRGWSWLGVSGSSWSWLERSCGCWSSMSRLVDDVASHVRLFKSARYKYKCPLKVKLQLTNCKHWISKRPNQKYQYINIYHR